MEGSAESDLPPVRHPVAHILPIKLSQIRVRERGRCLCRERRCHVRESEGHPSSLTASSDLQQLTQNWHTQLAIRRRGFQLLDPDMVRHEWYGEGVRRSRCEDVPGDGPRVREVDGVGRGRRLTEVDDRIRGAVQWEPVDGLRGLCEYPRE